MSELARIAARARETGRLGIDTEFLPEGRYRPLLCLVQIAGPRDMAPKLAAAVGSAGDRHWLGKVDCHLAGMSWDRTWEAMAGHLDRIHALNGAALMRKGA